MSEALVYRICPIDPGGHCFRVTLEIPEPSPTGQTLSLPTWIPGSYLIREFARHVLRVRARSGGRAVTVTKIEKNRWRLGACRASAVIEYEVYAWDLSVRAAHLDPTHGFFNGTSVFLRVDGQHERPCEVEIEAPPALTGASAWRVATTLPRAGARPHGFGRYRAVDYDTLVDHPVEMGSFALGRFEVAGVPHEIAITGQTDVDLERLCADLSPICEAQVAFFEPRSKRAPFDRYLFLTTAVGEGYGGLEHRDSTALLCNRNDLPYRGQTGLTEGYARFLGLASHEYFHAWHVKRIRPQAFVPYDLDRENPTRLLWIFEGFTSYYDDLFLARAGIFTLEDYLKALARTMSAVLAGPGRLKQSVADSSFDAWIKYYRQDEHSPNVIVSYYAKGALVALALDLEIRRLSGGTRSLDDVMRLLWQEYGRDAIPGPGRGLAEDAFPGIVQQASGLDLSAQIRAWAYGTRDLPLAGLLAGMGIELIARPGSPAPVLGIATVQRGAELGVRTAYTGGPAHQAGLSAGDVLVAVDGLKVDEKTLKALLERHRPGQRLRVHAFRRDELMEFEVVLAAAQASEVSLKAQSVDRATGAGRRSWLGRAGGLRAGSQSQKAR